MTVSDSLMGDGSLIRAMSFLKREHKYNIHNISIRQVPLWVNSCRLYSVSSIVRTGFCRSPSWGGR